MLGDSGEVGNLIDVPMRNAAAFPLPHGAFRHAANLSHFDDAADHFDGRRSRLFGLDYVCMSPFHEAECRQATLGTQPEISSRVARRGGNVQTMEHVKTPILGRTDFHADSGRRLRLLIERLGLKQVEAAELMGVTKHVLRNWLAGDHPISVYALYRLCKAKGVDFNYVFLGDWSHLPHSLAKQFDEELVARLAEASAADRRERETNDS